MNDTNPKYERKVIEIGNSKAVTIPTEILEWLGNPEEVFIMNDSGKYGKFIAIWNKKQKGEQ